MFSYSIRETKFDSARPFEVICDQKVLNRVKGRFATKAGAQAKVRRLNAA